MMFAIDLLKGKALPTKINLKKSIVKSIPLLIPVLAVTAIAAVVQHDRDHLQACQQTLHQQQQQIDQHAADVAEYNAIKRQVKATETYLKDISRALSYRVQVSDILTELVAALPEPIFIYEMDMERKSATEKIQLDDTSEPRQKLVVKRTLKLILCGYDAEQADPAVQEYLHRLGQSPLLSDIFTEIKHSSRQQGQVDNKDAIYYEIECTLREQGIL